MEVNASPGLEGVEKTTGVDIAGKMIAWIERHATPGYCLKTGGLNALIARFSWHLRLFFRKLRRFLLKRLHSDGFTGRSYTGYVTSMA